MTSVRPQAAPGEVAVIPVPSAGLEEAVRSLSGWRLADMFAGGSGGSSPRAGTAACDGETPVLRMVWADDAGGYVLTETPIEGEKYPLLSDVAPAAFVEECEIYEQFGVRPEGGKPLNRVLLPPHAGLPTLGRKPAEEPEQVRAPHTVGGQAFEFPFGPVRQAGVESLYYGLVTSGEEVVDLFLFTWHKHRGLEWRMRGLLPERACFFAERAEGTSAVGLGLAFARAVEAATGTRPPRAAERSRRVALELERLYNHAAAMAALCQSTGLSVGQSAAEMALEHFLRLNARAFGHRYLFGVVRPGGAARGPEADAIRGELPRAYGEFRRAADALLATNSFVDRLEATGIVGEATARSLGLVGPVARASGVRTDARLADPRPRDDPGHDNSNKRRGAVITATAGDVLARFTVMLGEAAESVALIGDLLDAGTSGQAAEVPATAGAGLGWAESPRGEALAWVALDGDGRIARARLRPGSVRNWRGFDDACRSRNVFTDIPIIEASFWLTVAGMAR